MPPAHQITLPRACAQTLLVIYSPYAQLTIRANPETNDTIDNKWEITVPQSHIHLISDGRRNWYII